MNAQLRTSVSLLLSLFLVGCQSRISTQYIDPDDAYTGWFRIQQRPSKNKSPDTIIPVFKIDGTYYSVCRGAEVPFKLTSEGLQWALEPSSMVGTTIGFTSSQPFIIIRDAQSEHFTSESDHPHDTGLRPMVRIDKPSWLLDPMASPPKSNDDFLGFYQPVWFPYYRIELYKDGQTYYERNYELDQEQNWQLQGESLELTLIAGELGFSYSNRQNRNALTYNKSLKRFEIEMQNPAPKLRIPLTRVLSALKDDKTVSFKEVIGIPTWH